MELNTNNIQAKEDMGNFSKEAKFAAEQLARIFIAQIESEKTKKAESSDLSV